MTTGLYACRCRCYFGRCSYRSYHREGTSDLWGCLGINNCTKTCEFGLTRPTVCLLPKAHCSYRHSPESLFLKCAAARAWLKCWRGSSSPGFSSLLLLPCWNTRGRARKRPHTCVVYHVAESPAVFMLGAYFDVSARTPSHSGDRQRSGPLPTTLEYLSSGFQQEWSLICVFFEEWVKGCCFFCSSST